MWMREMRHVMFIFGDSAAAVVICRALLYFCRCCLCPRLLVVFCVCHQFYGNVADDNFNHRLELNDPQKNHISSKIGSEDVAFPS